MNERKKERKKEREKETKEREKKTRMRKRNMLSRFLGLKSFEQRQQQMWFQLKK